MPSENKSCNAVYRLLDAYVSNELLTETNLDILDHLESCPACSALMESKARARAAVKLAVQHEPVPAALLASIRNSLPRSAQPATRQWAMAAVILAGVLLGSFGLWYMQPQKGSESPDTQRILDLGLAAYQHCPVDSGMDSLGWEYDGLVEAISEEKPSNYEITGAHRCMFNGRLFVTAVLQESGRPVTFVVTAKQKERFASDAAVEASGVSVYGGISGGHQVAGFETDRYLAFVVSDLNQDANLQIASSLAALYAPSARSTQKEARNGH